MPSPFCLLPKYADEFVRRVKSGELDPKALASMSSAERHAVFADIAGETNAGQINASFESKLLLKNQQAAIERWVKSAENITPQQKRDLLSRVERMRDVLEPQNADAFLSDLAKQRLGFGVTMEEAAQITHLAQEAAQAKAALENGGDRLAYGRAKVAFSNYVSDLKNGVKQPVTLGSALSKTASFAKSFKASFDNSALFRQGWKTLWTNPTTWAKNAKQSFVDLAKQFGGHEVLDEVNAEILSRPNALNGRYARAKLSIGNVEDQFPSSLPEKIPVVGRAFKASEAAYTGFLYRTRADVFDKYIEIAERSGADLDKTQLESIGKVVNSLTGRGNLGKAEGAANLVNNIFFSARKVKSDWDVLTAHTFDSELTPFARKQAATNLVKVIAGTAGALALTDVVARAFDHKNAVEWDFRSSDAGQLRIGNTRYDLTGGMRSIVTLAARLATMSSKSATTGKVTPINSGKFGSTSGTDLVYNFFENKLSPAASLVKDILKGRTFDGQPVTLTGEAANLFAPLPITNAIELAKDPSNTPASALLAMLADALGISTNTYAPKPKKEKP